MTNQQEAPEALRLAELLELAPEDGIEPQTSEDAAAELRRLHTENTALQQGYAAARLEIESLQVRIKTMAEEHADELMVAHLDGMRGRSTEPAGEYPAPTDAELDELRQANSGKLNFVTFSEFRTIARAVLARWGAQDVPASQGYALVPVEPTPEMVDAAQEAYMPFGDMQLAIQLAIAAAPQPAARSAGTSQR